MSCCKRITCFTLAFLFLNCLCFITWAFSQNPGGWSGSSNEGGDVNFSVIGQEVQNFEILAYLTGGSAGSGWLWLGIEPAMVIAVDDTFTFSNSLYDVTGTFTSSSSCSGTYDYHDPYLGNSNGTWSASYNPDPFITLSPSSRDFFSQRVGTVSGSFSFTLKNTQSGTASGAISLTGPDADQFDIVSGGEDFYLTHAQVRNINVQFIPTSTGSKTATLTIDGVSPCNDASATLTGTAIYPEMSITPDYQMVPATGGSVSFQVSNSGTDTMLWTAEVNAEDTWLTIESGDSGSDSGQITISYETNDGDARLGSITVTSDNGASGSPQVVEIVQAAKSEFRLTSNDGATDDAFGISVSISGDYAVVGASLDDDNGDRSGSAYVFEKTPDGWIQQAKLTASDGGAIDFFGESVNISGDSVIVGARLDDDAGASSGSAYIFEKPPGGWTDMTETAKLIPADGAEYDFYGYSVSIYGDYAVVGSHYDDDGDTNSGSVYLYERPVSGWADMTETAKLTASDAEGHVYFGHAVSVYADTIIVGNRYENHAYLFEKPPGGWMSMTETAKLSPSEVERHERPYGSVSITGDNVIISGDKVAYIFKKPSSGWTDMAETAKLMDSEGLLGDLVGDSVDIAGEYAILDGTGSAYVYKKSTSDWVDMSEITILTASNGKAFSGSVGVSGYHAIIGATGDDGNEARSGVAYIYDLRNSSPHISTIEDQHVSINSTTQGIIFTIYDSETSPDDLFVTGESTNTELVSNDQITFIRNGVNQEISITPEFDEIGSTTITVSVGDGTNIVSESFILTVAHYPGDINGDSRTDLADVILALHVLTSSEPSYPVYLYADTDGNDKIDIADALFILQQIVE